MSRMRLLLASRSPQRRAILEQLGIEFEVVVSDVEEIATGPPEEVALENARRKATTVATVAATGPRASSSEKPWVLGVDTVVALGDAVYGKPADRDEAESTLRALSGAVHRVVSGICLVDDPAAGARTALATTLVSFRPIDEPTLAGTWTPASGASAPAATRSRAAARPWWRRSRATI